MPNCTGGAATPSSGLFSDIYKRFTFIYRANDVIDNIGQVLICQSRREATGYRRM